MKQKDLNTLLRCAVRYAMGKNKSIEEEVARIVMDNSSIIDDRTAEIMKNDIEKFLERIECESHDIWNMVYYDLDEK